MFFQSFALPFKRRRFLTKPSVSFQVLPRDVFPDTWFYPLVSTGCSLVYPSPSVPFQGTSKTIFLVPPLPVLKSILSLFNPNSYSNLSKMFSRTECFPFPEGTNLSLLSSGSITSHLNFLQNYPFKISHLTSLEGIVFLLSVSFFQTAQECFT